VFSYSPHSTETPTQLQIAKSSLRLHALQRVQWSIEKKWLNCTFRETLGEGVKRNNDRRYLERHSTVRDIKTYNYYFISRAIIPSDYCN